MFFRLIADNFTRRPRRKLLTAAALSLGMAVATAALSGSLDVGDRLGGGGLFPRRDPAGAGGEGVALARREPGGDARSGFAAARDWRHRLPPGERGSVSGGSGPAEDQDGFLAQQHH